MTNKGLNDILMKICLHKPNLRVKWYSLKSFFWKIIIEGFQNWGKIKQGTMVSKDFSKDKPWDFNRIARTQRPGYELGKSKDLKGKYKEQKTLIWKTQRLKRLFI